MNTVSDTGALALEAYGVPFVLSASDPDLLARLERAAPPGSVAASAAGPGERFSLARDEEGIYRVFQDDAEALACGDLELALGVLGSIVREHIALQSTVRFFIRGGVVVRGGRAILVLGPSLSGRSTLVSGLVDAGASFWSDQYAVLDGNGSLHPYGELTSRAERGPGERGSDSADRVPLGIVAVTSYRPGAIWNPRVGTAGDAVLALLSHTIAARERPAETLAAVRRAAAEAVLVESERSEASAAARELLALADNAASP